MKKTAIILALFLVVPSASFPQISISQDYDGDHSYALAVANNDVMLCAWRNAGDNWSRILGRRFYLHGAPKGDVINISGDERNAYWKSVPSPAVHPETGNFFVVWSEDDDGQNRGGVFLRIFNNNGEPISANIKISPDIYKANTRPKIQYREGDNDFIVMWYSGNNALDMDDTTGLIKLFLDPDGHVISEPERAIEKTQKPLVQQPVAFVFNPRNSIYLLVCREVEVESNWQRGLFAFKFDSWGFILPYAGGMIYRQLPSEVCSRLYQLYTGGAVYNNEKDQFLACWDQINFDVPEGNIFLRVLSGDGDFIDGKDPKPIVPGADFRAMPDVIYVGGQYFVVFREGGSPFNDSIKMARLDSNGDYIPNSKETVASWGYFFGPRIFYNAQENKFFVFYSRTSGGKTDNWKMFVKEYTWNP